jgi:hypothetical protein
MADITFFAPVANETLLVAHALAWSRADDNTGVVDGNKIHPTAPASMSVVVDAGTICLSGAVSDVDEDADVEIQAAHLTQDRIDIIYRDTGGDVQVLAGAVADIDDPLGNDDWHEYTSPVPNDSIPEGVILGAVYVGHGVTSIGTSDIWMFGVRVSEIDLSDLESKKHTQGTDQAIDSGGANQCTASQLKDAVDKKHDGASQVAGPSSAVASNLAEFDGTTGKILKDGLLTHANVNSAVSLKHTQGTDAGLDTGGSYPVTAQTIVAFIAAAERRPIEVIFDGSGAAIAANSIVRFICDYACTIKKWTIIAHTAGAIQFDIRKCTYAQFDDGSTHPVSGDSIVAFDKPKITATSTKGNGSSLTGWTTAITKGDILEFLVESCTSITQATISLEVSTP